MFVLMIVRQPSSTRSDTPFPHPALFRAAIERFGLLQLLVDGIARRGTLTPPRLADLRSALGWPHDRDEVLAGGEAITDRSEEHTSELQSLMRISYAVFCLEKNSESQFRPLWQTCDTKIQTQNPQS